MKLIDRLTSSPNQQSALVSGTSDTIPFALRYMPRQQMWVFGLAYKDFTSNGNILQCSPNILRQYRHILPFGLQVVSEDGLGPTYLDDFTTGRIKLYLLTADEVQAVEDALFV